MENYISFKKMHLSLLCGLLLLTALFSNPTHAYWAHTSNTTVVHTTNVYHGYGYHHGYTNVGATGYGHGTVYHNGNVHHYGYVYHR